MLPFYKLLAGIGFGVLICLLFVLIFSQIFFNSQDVHQDINNCPDKWIYDNSAGIIRCFVPLDTNGNISTSNNGGRLHFDVTKTNILDVYNNNTPGKGNALNGKPYINFRDRGWFDKSTEMPSRVCYLQQWTNANEISWRGVSNNYNCG